MKEKTRKNFVLIAKVDKYTFVKYRVNDYLKGIDFVNKKYKNTLFINIFYNNGINKRKLAYTWGKNKGLELAEN